MPVHQAEKPKLKAEAPAKIDNPFEMWWSEHESEMQEVSKGFEDFTAKTGLKLHIRNAGRSMPLSV